MSRMIDDEETLKDNGLIEIDGCNVAECEFYTVIEDCDGIHDICELYDEYCNTKKNCHFKQMQRAKAELEQYKKSKQASYEAMQADWNKAVNELRDLKASDIIEFKQYYKAENERLQAENDTLHITISKLKEDLSQAETSVYALKAENEKQKKELEWQKVANRKFLLDKDFLTSELRDLRIEYAKLYQLNEKLKKALESEE